MHREGDCRKQAKRFPTGNPRSSSGPRNGAKLSGTGLKVRT